MQSTSWETLGWREHKLESRLPGEWQWKCSVVSDSLWPHGLYSLWNSLGQNTGVGSLSLLQGIFPTQGSNPGLLHCKWILYQLSHKGSPRILEWVAYPFSSISSWPRNQTGVSCIAGSFFTNWAMRKSPRLLEEISITSDMQMNHPYGRKWRTKEPLDESERGTCKNWFKAQHSEK